MVQFWLYLRKSAVIERGRNIIAENLREIFFFILLLFILLISNHNITLFDQDEAAYAGFGKYFLENPQAHIPQFLWSEPHRKTPLHFWLITFSYKIFGINEFAVRFPSALAVFFTYLLCFFKTKKYFSTRIAFLSTAILGTSFFVPLMAKMALTDALLFLWSSICGWAVIEIVESGKWSVESLGIPNNKNSFFQFSISCTERSRSINFQLLTFWLAFSLAVLTKGPPIFIFTGIFAIIIFAFSPQRFQLFRFHPWFFLPLALMPIGYWAYLTTQEDGGEFLTWFIDWYILKRVNSYVFGQTGPPGYYLLTFIGFFLPYLPLLFPALYQIFRYMGNAILSYFPQKIQTFFPNREKEIGIHFLLSAWFVAAWLIYEILPSKLPSYTLAAYMPLAIMMAIFADKMISNVTEKGNIIAYIHTFLMLCVGIGLCIAPFWIELPTYSLILLRITGVLLSVGTFSAFYFVQKQQTTFYIYTLLANAALFLLLVWGLVVPSLDNMRNATKQVATYLSAKLPQDIPIFIANAEGKPPSLPFYLSLHFKNIHESEDIHNLYKSNLHVGFILNEAQFSDLKALEPIISGQFFSTYRTDRGGKSAYWVVVK